MDSYLGYLKKIIKQRSTETWALDLENLNSNGEISAFRSST